MHSLSQLTYTCIRAELSTTVFYHLFNFHMDKISRPTSHYSDNWQQLYFPSMPLMMWNTTRLGLVCQTPVKNLCPCQFRKPQFQKLCFLPSLKFILGLKKFWFRKLFWAWKESYVWNEFSVQKNFGSE